MYLDNIWDGEEGGRLDDRKDVEMVWPCDENEWQKDCEEEFCW